MVLSYNTYTAKAAEPMPRPGKPCLRLLLSMGCALQASYALQLNPILLASRVLVQLDDLKQHSIAGTFRVVGNDHACMPLLGKVLTLRSAFLLTLALTFSKDPEHQLFRYI